MHSSPTFCALARVALPLAFVAGACASGESAPGSGGGGGTVATGGTGGSSGSVPTGATSIDAVEAALEAGDISEADAIRYKVFAVFGDERLPDRFRSAAPMEDGTRVLSELAESFDGLPTDVQKELDPFLRPPSDPLSWYQLREAESAEKDHNPLFDHISAVGGEVLVQWPNGKEHLRPDAEKVADALNGPSGVWAKLTTLMGREPLRDDGIIEKYNGGDGRFDIYVIEDSNTKDHSAVGWAVTYLAGTSGHARTTYMVMNRDRIQDSTAGFDAKLRSNLAHEFMHVLQFTYDVSEPWSNYYWLMESTSTWAEHFVFKDDDVEQEDASAYLGAPHFALTSLSRGHEYGAYLYWYFLTENPGGDPGTITQVWELSESMNSEEAANEVSPGGFESTFADFAVANWNQTPFSDKGNAPWDVYSEEGLPPTEEGMKLTAAATKEHPAPNPEDDIEVSFELGGVARLSATYVHYDLADLNISTVLFANGYTFELTEGTFFISAATLQATRIPEEERKGRQVIALMKQNGTWRLEPFDLTEVAFAPFCNDASSESLEELLLIFINAEYRTDEPFYATPRGLPPRLLTSNIGCGKWSGTGSAQETILDGSNVQFTNVDITKIEFTRPTLTLDQIANGDGQIRFGDEIIPGSGFSPDGIVGDAYELTDLEATWTFDEDYTNGGVSCAGSGSGAFTEADASSSTFRISTHLRRGSGASDTHPLYRSFFYRLSLFAPGEPISGTCVSNGQTSPYTSDLAVFMESGYRIPGIEIQPIEPSGDRINASWSFEDSDMELHLMNGPIP